MRRRFLTLGIILLVLTGFLTPVSNVFAEGNTFFNIVPGGELVSLIGPTVANSLFSGIGTVLLSLSALALTLSGTLFDAVLNFTVIQMSSNLTSQSLGIGNSINVAWTTLRDIANLFFIFVLLFSAFKAMFDLDVASIGRTIVNIIIVALLINFSLFLTKVVIDASNIVSVGFYKAVVTSNTYTLTTSGQNGLIATTTPISGISGGYMRLLGMQGWYSDASLDPKLKLDWKAIITVGFMGSVFFLMTAIILLISTFMFIARFILLVFIMILSPLAAVAYIIPGGQKQFSKWLSALINQSFFAPIFLALTWVTFKVASAPGFLGAGLAGASNKQDFVKLVMESPSQNIGLVINYILVMGFAVTSLIMAKRMASETPYFADITTGLSTGALGLSAWAGRQTIGRGLSVASQSSSLRNMASEDGFRGFVGRSMLRTASRGASSSYDVRAIDTLGKVPGLGKEMGILGKAGGKGGFNKIIEDKAKAKAKYAKDVYGSVPEDNELDEKEEKRLQKEINDLKEAEKAEITKNRIKTLEDSRQEFKNQKQDIKTYERTKLKNDYNVDLDVLEKLKKDLSDKEAEIRTARTNGVDTSKMESLRKESESISRSITIENQRIEDALKNMSENDDVYIGKKESLEDAKESFDDAKKARKAEIKDNDYSNTIKEKIKNLKEFKDSGKRRQREYAQRINSGIFGWSKVNQAAKREIDKQTKEKTKEQKLLDILEEGEGKKPETKPENEGGSEGKTTESGTTK